MRMVRRTALVILMMVGFAQSGGTAWGADAARPGGAAAGAGGAASAPAARTWDYAGGGQWPLAEGPAAAEADNATLDRAERLLSANKADEAEDLLVPWVKSNHTAPDRDRALYLLAEVYYQQGQRIKAFYQLDEIIETYPESRYFYLALEKQYAIADAYLKGRRDALFGIGFLRVLDRTDEAIDMLFRIQERSPGSPLAERALLRTGDYYYNTGQFDLAGDVYAAYLRSYARSSEAPRVRLRRAFAAYAQFRGVRYDATPLIEARAQLEDYRVKYPERAAEVNVQQFLDNIDSALARKLLWTADFYERTNHASAAAYTYRQLMATYPNAPEARSAAAALKALPASALADLPAPGQANPFAAAATRPATPGAELNPAPGTGLPGDRPQVAPPVPGRR